MLLTKKILLVFLALLISCAMVYAGGQADKEEAAVEGKKDNVAELWHYWAVGGEVEALNNLLTGFRKEHPDINVIDRVISGGSHEKNRQLGLSFMAGNPPELFLTGPGYQAKEFYLADRLIPMDKEWAEIDGDKIFPAGLVKMMRWDDKTWCIPLNIHAINGVWYNVKLFKKYNVKIPQNFEEMKQACNVFKENGIQAIAGAPGPWPLFALWPFLVEKVGTEGYMDLAAGTLSWEDNRIKEAFNLYKEVWIDNLIKDWSGYSWVDAAKLMMKDEVAMYWCMGDWFVGFMISQGFEPITQFDVFMAPTSQKVLIGQVDCFALAKGSGDVDLAKEVLKYTASVDGQARFAKYKGSIAANINVPRETYNPITAKMHDYINKPDVTYLPNMSQAIMRDFEKVMMQEIGAWCLDPTSEGLKEMLANLEDYRIQAALKGEWVRWE